jgi:membrane-bound lytic murein transglycosylase MltF
MHLRRLLWIITIALCLSSAPGPPGRAESPKTAGEAPAVSLQRVDEIWKGDLSEILETRRFIRVLVSYNRTNFFIDRGQPRGLEYELLHRYEAHLNRQSPRGTTKIKLFYRVLPFDQLLPALVEGRGDIAAAGLTITPPRQKRVAFTRPYIKNVNEIVVASKRVSDLEAVEDLSGRQVNVVAGSSYVRHLKKLNRRLRKQGQPAVKIVPVDPHLEAEDILQMVNAGIFDLTVIDAHVADIWSAVLTDMVLRRDLAVNAGGEIAWAVRKENPQLLADLNAFLTDHRQGTLTGNVLLKRYFENARFVSNPVNAEEMQKVESLRSLFRKYAGKYGFDWLKIAALAYQESRLDQNARSPRGAVGIMQILPSTAAGPAVNIPDISTVENNIHAGVKYLAHLRDTYFNDPALAAEDRVDFTFAAYNAGPSKINRLRRRAAEEGLDPNRWERNVEYVARKVIGPETDRYVANVHMYYVAYTTSLGIVSERQQQLQHERR